MVRSTADATRFTATGPHAFAKGQSTSISPSSPAPPNETPQQKVARLREAARQARISQESTFDKIVVSGRRWADRGHKITVTALIGLGVLSTGIALYATADMMLYNRRKRREWFAEQQLKYDQALARARTAEATGTLTPDLALILNKERAVEQAEAEKQNKKGLWRGAKDWVFGGLAKQERPGGALGLGSEEIRRIADGLPAFQNDDDTDGKSKAIDLATPRDPHSPSLSEQSIVRTSSTSSRGGPLDQLGEQTSQSLGQISRNWINWARGR